MNQIIVCEGIHDQMRINSIYHDAMVLTTNGREISDTTLDMIKKLSIDNEIILFLDPDSPGERIRSRILEIVPNASNAFMPKKKCISANHKKVGIEHASSEDIILALSKVYRYKTLDRKITINDLYSLRLTGFTDSAIQREKVSAKLNIGNPNAKTFLKRLNMFGINLETLKEIMNE